MITRWTTPVCRMGLLYLAGLTALGGVHLAYSAPSLAQSLPQARAQRPLLEPDDSGPQVRQLQLDLADLGLYAGSIDGIYGDEMAQAVRSLQRQEGIVVDGIVGAQTWLVLEAQSQSVLILPTPKLKAKTLAFTPLVVAQPAPPPSALWLGLMPLVPLVGGGLTYLHRRMQHQQVFRRRPRRQLPPKPPCSGKGPL
ncbi:MAG: peptidoglycan-binding domain-containing protein [Nodosilinea sp.]